MSSVSDAKVKYEAAKSAETACQISISELQAKAESLEQQLPGLSRAVEAAEKAKTAALDAFALSESTQTETTLRQARKTQAAAAKLFETQEMLDAVERNVERLQAKLAGMAGLNAAYEAAKRELFLAIFDEIKSNIPPEVILSVRTLFGIGVRISRGRDGILDALFPPMHIAEFREAINNSLSKKYGLIE